MCWLGVDTLARWESSGKHFQQTGNNMCCSEIKFSQTSLFIHIVYFVLFLMKSISGLAEVADSRCRFVNISQGQSCCRDRANLIGCGKCQWVESTAFVILESQQLANKLQTCLHNTLVPRRTGGHMTRWTRKTAGSRSLKCYPTLQ